MEAALELSLQTESVDALLRKAPKGVLLKRVDFSKVLLPEAVDTQNYQILISHEMSRGVAVLFPNNAQRPLIWAHEYRSIRKWNDALNETLSNSLDETTEAGDTKLCVAHGKYIYICRRFTGRLYIFWAHVHYGDGVLGTCMPVLINMDAKLQPKAVMVLQPNAERIPLTRASPVLKWNRKRMGGHPFVCEERRLNPLSIALPIAQRERDALYEQTRSTPPVHTKPLLIHNPFERSLDHESTADDSGVTVHVSSVEYEEEDNVAVAFTKPVEI